MIRSAHTRNYIAAQKACNVDLCSGGAEHVVGSTGCNPAVLSGRAGSTPAVPTNKPWPGMSAGTGLFSIRQHKSLEQNLDTT